MKTKTMAWCLFPTAVLGCASTQPSSELVDARRAYDNARAAPQAQYTPERVLEAKQALDRAERAHAEDPGSHQEKSLAYIATRRSELAVVYGDYELDRRNREAAEVDYKRRQNELRRQAEGTTAATQRELDGTRSSLNATQNSLAGARTELSQEREARQTAERNAQAAMASLEQVARVKEEARGMVITLDGSVLFVSGKAELLPIARQKLDQVATALDDTAPEQKIVVEGHTDSNGSDASNLKLSQDRADAVRVYLIEKGVKADRIRGVGKGEGAPVASNDTAEGRANNRRVEIIVEKNPAR